jgi:hypothetical protein
MGRTRTQELGIKLDRRIPRPAEGTYKWHPLGWFQEWPHLRVEGSNFGRWTRWLSWICARTHRSNPLKIRDGILVFASAAILRSCLWAVDVHASRESRKPNALFFICVPTAKLGALLTRPHWKLRAYKANTARREATCQNTTAKAKCR